MKVKIYSYPKGLFPKKYSFNVSTLIKRDTAAIFNYDFISRHGFGEFVIDGNKVMYKHVQNTNILYFRKTDDVNTARLMRIGETIEVMDYDIIRVGNLFYEVRICQ